MSWTTRRRLVQLGVAVFYLLLPGSYLLGQRAVAGNLAALKTGPVDLVEPAAGLAAALAATHLTWTLILGVLPLVLLALLLGPVFCSWICPWGLVCEGVDRLRRSRRSAGWTGHRWRRIRVARATVLAGLLVLGFALATPLAAIVSAPRLISSLPLEVIYLRVLSPVTASLLLSLLALELLGPRRLWCRALCPVGSLANYLRNRFTLRVRFDPTTCLCPSVARCLNRCPWGIDPRRAGRFDGCTNCFACIDVCPRGSLEPGWDRPQRTGRDRE